MQAYRSEVNWDEPNEGMNEREMEDLIAAHVEDFFPRRLFVLKGRQGTCAGVGRFDLFFEDQFQNNILMELN
jgi:hypothetical protein